jgi:hypothetical protein
MGERYWIDWTYDPEAKRYSAAEILAEIGKGMLVYVCTCDIGDGLTGDPAPFLHHNSWCTVHLGLMYVIPEHELNRGAE